MSLIWKQSITKWKATIPKIFRLQAVKSPKIDTVVKNLSDKGMAKNFNF